MTLSEDPLQRLINQTIGHGMLVLFIGLVAGVMLVFSLLEVVTLWPLPAWEVDIPGSTRGWQAAHKNISHRIGVKCGVKKLIQRPWLDAFDRLHLTYQTLIDHTHRNAQSSASRALSTAGLQHPKFSFLDGEFDILHVAVVVLQQLIDSH